MTAGRLRRGALLVAGVLCTGLAIAGVVLPLVPATPFLLLASACFAKSSPRLQRWLCESPLVGRYLVQWQRDRTVPRGAKRKAFVLTAVSFGVSIALVGLMWVRLVLLAVAAAVMVVIGRLPTGEPSAGEDPGTRAGESPDRRIGESLRDPRGPSTRSSC